MTTPANLDDLEIFDLSDVALKKISVGSLIISNTLLTLVVLPVLYSLTGGAAGGAARQRVS